MTTTKTFYLFQINMAPVADWCPECLLPTPRPYHVRGHRRPLRSAGTSDKPGRLCRMWGSYRMKQLLRGIRKPEKTFRWDGLTVTEAKVEAADKKKTGVDTGER